MLLEKNAVVYRGSGFIGGAVARALASVTSGTFSSYMTRASMTTQLRGKAA